MKNIKIILLLTFLLLLSGCIREVKQDSTGLVEISFKKSLSKEEMTNLDGKEVEIIGFYSVIKDVDGGFAYLMSTPYHTCLYCTEDAAHSFSNTLAIHPKSGTKFEYTDLPVTARGKFKIEETDDKYGNHYNYKLLDVEISDVDDTKLTKEAKLYKGLIEKDFVGKFNLYMNQIAYLSDYIDIGLATSQLKQVDISIIEELKLISIGNKDYKDINIVIEKAENLGVYLNNLYSEGLLEEMLTKRSEAQDIYDGYYKWLTKPEY